jgi:hypothetical protein
MLLHVLHVSSKGANSGNSKSSTATGIDDLDPSMPIPESMILQAWNGNIDVLKAKFKDRVERHSYNYHREQAWNEVKSAVLTLSWMFSSMLELHVGYIVVAAFSEDSALSDLMVAYLKNHPSSSSYGGRDDLDCLRCLTSLLSSMVNAMQRGRVLLPLTVRIAFLTTWLPTVQTIHSSYKELYLGCGALSGGLKAMIHTLPLSDREKFFKDYMKPDDDGKTDYLDFNSSFAEWCSSLKESVLLGQGQPLQLVVKSSMS